MKSLKCELNRREFLSTLTTSAGFLAVGLSPRAFASEILLPGEREASKCLGIPRCAPIRDLYQIRALSERAVLQMYARLLQDACEYADRDWRISSFDSAAGYWGDGVSSGNGGIRTAVSMVLSCGALIKYDDTLSTARSQGLLDKAAAALRYAAATHVTGTQKCTNGRQWGATEKFGSESWQSGMWTGTLAFGAWLIWNKLDASVQRDIERVVASENDVLSQRQPPNGLWLDTKAEENGWEVPCLVLGELMFSSHPNASVWHETALRYMMNTLSTEADLHDGSLVDGRTVNQWVKGANLQPDFTLENHGIFHPSYVGCSCYFLTQAAMYCTYGGRPIPQAATHHLMDTWRMFQAIILPLGEAAYPQGMDWELHGLPFINLYAALATQVKDPFAAHMEQCSLQYMRAWQEMGQGSLAFPGSHFGITRHAINAEQAAYGLLAHKVFGAATTGTTTREVSEIEKGIREYPHVGFIAHRTEKKFASFSWKNKIMGQLIPIGEGHEGNPNFTVPITNGFVGSFELVPSGDIKTTVAEHSWKNITDGFETKATLLLNGGRLKQTLRMISLGSQTVFYEDRVTAVSDVTVQSERGLPVGIENDEITGGLRLLSSHEGQVVIDWQKPRQPIDLPGSWVNVDSRLGLVKLAGAGMTYAQATAYSPGISVYTDILYGSLSDHLRQFKAGDEVARRIAILVVEVTPQETLALAQSCRIEEKPSGRVLRFRQPSGEHAEVTIA